ncbi:FprA family A-type flavoprotein [Treponema phagedenis]|uniref:Metallo-beta-lactamase domain protein n=1 Tax=Treponema phagedenis TaxID=162 RepID=A0A0B7GUG1_TREPH|nr:FprA family A-type flavoprotein [Treponema phagedenis]QSH99191.1 FprA family A-type flavoprotein [Treponema phagedenis]CEM62123.1 Metallo-beta-lactamase domain protein [Treponema phagedenis]
MNDNKLTDSVYCIHADIHDRTARFEGLWMLPQGVSINSYIILGEKVALIDIVRDWDNSLESYKKQLANLNLSFEKIDYVILNHLEPDHADLLATVHAANPNVEIIASAKGIAMVEKFFKISGNLRIVKNEDTLDLGKGKILQFFETPNIHWPETMMTYDVNEKILFSCDGFGSYGCIRQKIFDDLHSEKELDFFENEALRYYSNIVASFSNFVLRGIAKLQSLDIRMIAPSHGIVWRKNTQRIIELYKKFAGYNTGGPCEKEICIIWGSMYGYTKQGIDAVIKGIEEEGVPYHMYQIPDTDVSYILHAAYSASGLVIAMPTYEYKMFPPMAYVLDLFNRKHFYQKKVLRIGSWGWSGGAQKEYEQLTANLKWTNIEPYEWQGTLVSSDLSILTDKGRELTRLVKNNGEKE